jgi:hypothetical protein
MSFMVAAYQDGLQVLRGNVNEWGLSARAHDKMRRVSRATLRTGTASRIAEPLELLSQSTIPHAVDGGRNPKREPGI